MSLFLRTFSRGFDKGVKGVFEKRNFQRAFHGSQAAFNGSIVGLRTKSEVDEFVGKLNDEQKGVLFKSLSLEILRDGPEPGESQYLSRFGRPTAQTALDDQSPLPAEVESTTVSLGDIWRVGFKNALPFIGFGFLDNLIMILAGDYIDLTIGMTLGISTMAAAALGNTISDVAGIASAWYVEFFAGKLGLKEPNLSAVQMATLSVRWASNIGRAIGVVIGCLLGMIPLLFLNHSTEKKEETKEKRKAAAEANEKSTK